MNGRVLARAGAGDIGASMATADTPTIDVCDHVKWCRGIASAMAEALGFQGSSKDDLIAVALLELVAVAARFDIERVPVGGSAGGQLRGLAHPSIKGAVQREARRLRNAGTYSSRREKNLAAVLALRLPIRRDERGDQQPAGAHLASDGRRPGTPTPLEILIAREGDSE